MPALEWPDDGRHVLVGGEWVEVESPEPIDSTSPIDEQLVGRIAAARPRTSIVLEQCTQ